MFWYKVKFLFPKKKKQVLPKQKFNQNYKRERERERRLCHGKLKKHNTKTHIKKKKKIMIEDLDTLGLIFLIIIIVTKIMNQADYNDN